jgi:Flp pilus assembly protein TadD
MWQASTQARRLVEANRLGGAGQYAASLQEARQVTMTPASDRALLTEAYDLEDLGRLREADRAFARAAAADPSNWVIRRDWALELRREGQSRRARVQMRRAISLNPKLVPTA